MIRSDNKLAHEAVMALPVTARSRVPEHQFDYGDEGTLLKSLKRVGRNPFAGNPNDMFALFLGCYEGKYIVGVHNLGNQFGFNATEAFDSVEEMKIEWQLD